MNSLGQITEHQVKKVWLLILQTYMTIVMQAYFFNQNAASQATDVAGKLSFVFQTLSFFSLEFEF